MKNSLTVYVFDLDDNILEANTKIFGYESVNQKYNLSNIKTSSDIEDYINKGFVIEKYFSTSEFALAKEDSSKYYFDFDTAFLDFRDFGKKGKYAFIDDVREAIQNEKFSPSWGDFKECLKNGYLFQICTARGHEPDTIKELARMIIFNSDINNQGLTNNELLHLYTQLSKFHSGSVSEVIEEYLDDCDFCGISSQYFADKFLDGKMKSPKDPSKYKEMAIENFFLKCNKIANKHNINLEYGFSDDDISNVNKIQELFKLLKKNYSCVKFAVYDTSKGYKETRYME